MPVEYIQIVQCHKVEILFHLLYVEKVTSYIEMHAPVCQAGIVFDVSLLESNFVACLYRGSLTKCLYPIEDTGMRSSGYGDTVAAYGEPVTFRIFYAFVYV